MIMTSARGSTTYLSAVLVLIICRYANSDLIMKPADAEAVVGHTTFFNCSTTLTSEIRWFHYVVGDAKFRSVVYESDQFYSPYLGRFQMEKNIATGSYNLIITSVSIDDAGRYECRDDSGLGDKDSAQLIVLDENPMCQSNIKPQGFIGPNICGFEPDELHMTCGVKYHGNQLPIMQWKEAGSDKVIVEGDTRNASSDRANYYLKIEVNSRMDGSSYQCVTTRSRKAQYGCTSDVISVRDSSRTYVIIIVTCVLVGLFLTVTSAFAGFKAGERSATKKRETEELLPRPITDDLTEKNKELETELENERSEANTLKQQLQNLQKKNKASESEIIPQMDLDMTDLEESLYPAGSFTNEEIKRRVKNVYAQFVSDVDPDRLSDWLIQDNVVTIDQWQRIRLENPFRRDRCRALLDHLFSIKHPRAFLVLRQAVEKEHPHLRESIDTQKPECEIRVQPGTQSALQGQTKNSNHEKSPASKSTEQIELIYKQDKDTIETQRAEIRKLRAKVNELEQQMYCSDNKTRKTSATLAHTIVTKAAEKMNGETPITGMTILDNSLFVVKKNYPVVEVYDSETFVFVRLIDKLCFTNPLDIASSKENKLLGLYVIDRRNGESESIIRKFNTDGNGYQTWPTENDNGRLSTYGANLIVCFSTKRIIIEYTPEGETVNVVRLSPGNRFDELWHAVKLTGTHFVVSHSTVEDDQRVCVVDMRGSVLSAFEKLPALSKNVLSRDHIPICLVGQGDESVLVADARHRRVLLLSPKELKYKAQLLETDITQIPLRLCLNEAKNRLFVGIFSTSKREQEGRILIYNLTK